MACAGGWGLGVSVFQQLSSQSASLANAKQVATCYAYLLPPFEEPAVAIPPRSSHSPTASSQRLLRLQLQLQQLDINDSKIKN